MAQEREDDSSVILLCWVIGRLHAVLGTLFLYLLIFETAFDVKWTQSNEEIHSCVPVKLFSHGTRLLADA